MNDLGNPEPDVVFDKPEAGQGTLVASRAM